MKMKLFALALVALFLGGCAGAGFSPSTAHPDAYEAARGPGGESSGDGEGGDGEGGDAE